MNCLRRYFDKEVIDCAYKCDRCGRRTQIVKKLDIVLPPPILTVQVKRFGNAGRRKINTFIQVDKDVDVDEFVAEEVMLKHTKYEVFAIAVHLGHSIELGHYVAFVKRNGRWFECNDESVCEVKERAALSKNAYLVFYRRKDGESGEGSDNVNDDDDGSEEEETEEEEDDIDDDIDDDNNSDDD
jgi:ubiquitin C-terminal hydrolase